MTEHFDLWKLLAGLGIFMFGIFLMEESIKKLSGKAFKKLIREYTGTKIKAILSGTFVTAILQSSSAVSLMVLAFVGAGIMSLENALGVVMGSNLGTTATSWIVATLGFRLDIESFALPFVGIGGLGLIFLGKSEKYSNISKLLVGFGFLFMGLDYMKTSVEVFTETFDITQLQGYNMVVYLLVGIAVTVVMQSSSAAMALILTGLNAGILSFGDATAMVIGANVGTTVTVFIGALGGTQSKKRVAMSHLTFNLVTGIVAFAMIPVLTYLIQTTFGMKEDPLTGLALFHTLFNLIGVALFFPFLGLLVATLMKFYPDRVAGVTYYLDRTSPKVAEAAIPAVKKETMRLFREILGFCLMILSIEENLALPNNRKDLPPVSRKRKTLKARFDNIRQLQGEIFTYAAKVASQELSKKEKLELRRYLHAARISTLSAKNLIDTKSGFDELDTADNRFLNDGYIQFRRRLMSITMKMDDKLNSKPEESLGKKVEKLNTLIEKEDKKFIKNTTKAVTNHELNEIEVTNVLLVNREFNQAIRQLIRALQDLVFIEGKEENEEEEIPDIELKDEILVEKEPDTE